MIDSFCSVPRRRIIRAAKRLASVSAFSMGRESESKSWRLYPEKALYCSHSRGIPGTGSAPLWTSFIDPNGRHPVHHISSPCRALSPTPTTECGGRSHRSWKRCSSSILWGLCPRCMTLYAQSHIDHVASLKFVSQPNHCAFFATGTALLLVARSYAASPRRSQMQQCSTPL
jgi:hypothetical protein